MSGGISAEKPGRHYPEVARLVALNEAFGERNGVAVHNYLIAMSQAHTVEDRIRAAGDFGRALDTTKPASVLGAQVFAAEELQRQNASINRAGKLSQGARRGR